MNNEDICTIYEYRYDIMLKCWEQKVNDRPTFSNLTELISQVMEPLADYLDVSTFVALESDVTVVDESNNSVTSNPIACESLTDKHSQSYPSQQTEDKERVDEADGCTVIFNPLNCGTNEHSLPQNSPKDVLDTRVVDELMKIVTLPDTVSCESDDEPCPDQNNPQAKAIVMTESENSTGLADKVFFTDDENFQAQSSKSDEPSSKGIVDELDVSSSEVDGNVTLSQL